MGPEKDLERARILRVDYRRFPPLDSRITHSRVTHHTFSRHASISREKKREAALQYKHEVN